MANRIVAILILMFAGTALAAVPTTQGKKIIAYGADWPNTAYVREHIQTMEKLPFDGIVIGVSKSQKPEQHGETIGNRLLEDEPIAPDVVEAAINDLKNTHFKKFTDNFLQIETMPGGGDYYDDTHWSLICEKFKAFARIAKQGGITGLEIDPEEYDAGHIWTPSKWVPERRHGKSQDQLIAQAKLRGRQVMQAINSEYPGVQILFLFGPSFSDYHIREGNDKYLLLTYFIEGMADAADSGTHITDGYEQSYSYRIPAAFRDGREAILDAKHLFTDKAVFDRVMRVGFGLCLDDDTGFANDPASIAQRLPAKKSAVYNALLYTDRYVWTWHATWNGWEHYIADQEEAYREGRKGPTEIPVVKLPLTSPIVESAAKAANQKDYSDEATFADLLKNNTIIGDLHGNWMFKPDPKDEGVVARWFTAKLDPAGWSPIQVGKFWEEQGWDYDGVAWYRTHFTVNPLPDQKILLAFGAADESAAVYLNGKKIGTHDIGEIGWDQPFAFDITHDLKQGDNQLTVRVFDRTGPGGLWKSVKLMVAH